MLETKYKCDLCDKEYATDRQGHANAEKNHNKSLNYLYSDIVHFPPGWEKLGANIICCGCLSRIRKVEPV